MGTRDHVAPEIGQVQALARTAARQDMLAVM
jgi:hypothetical protein